MKHAEAKGYKYVMIDEIASGINEKRNGIHIMKAKTIVQKLIFWIF